MKPVLVSPRVSIAADSVVCHSFPGQIPDYAEQELARLHAGRYSSLAHFEVYGHADTASTYIASRGGEPAALLLYRRDGDVVRVLNEGIPLSEAEARRLAGHLMSGDDAPAAVLFRAVAMEPAEGDALLQRVECEQDSILILPQSRQAYLASLGASTRSMLKNRLNKIKRELPGFEYKVYEQDQVDAHMVRAILDLQRTRIAGKRGAVIVDEIEEQRVLQMVARCGIVGVATVDGHCCGGSIAYRHGDTVSGLILAHDSAYDVYRMGFLCSYLMCSACTEREGIRQFNFGWGREPYKAQLGGKARALSDVAIYRSHWQRLRLAPLSLQLTLRGAMFQLRKRLRAMRRQSPL